MARWIRLRLASAVVRSSCRMCRCCVSKKIHTGSSDGSSSRRILRAREESGAGSAAAPPPTMMRQGREGEDALDRLLDLVEAALRVAQLLAERRAQVANDLLDLAPHLVVDALLLLLLLRRRRDGEPEELRWTRREDVPALLVRLERDLVPALRASSDESVVLVDDRQAGEGTTHLLDRLAQDRRQVEEELAALKHAERALEALGLGARVDDRLEDGLGAGGCGCSGRGNAQSASFECTRKRERERERRGHTLERVAHALDAVVGARRERAAVLHLPEHGCG